MATRRRSAEEIAEDEELLARRPRIEIRSVAGGVMFVACGRTSVQRLEQLRRMARKLRGELVIRRTSTTRGMGQVLAEDREPAKKTRTPKWKPGGKWN